jgi:hypothetical protein
MLGPGSLQGSDAFATTTHSLCACGCGVGCGAVGHVSVGDVSATRRRRLQVQLVVEAQRRGIPDCLCRAYTLAVRTSIRFVCGVFIKRAVFEERRGALVALLLETLGAHGAKEAVGCQRNMGSAGRCRWATLVS